MKIFILEDNDERIKLFNRWFSKHTLVFSKEVNDAFKKIQFDKFDLIFLDHDLDNRHYVDSNEENTGYQLAKMIHETVNKHTKVIVHSLNIVGVRNMLPCLTSNEAEYIPFGSFNQDLLAGN